MPMTTELNPSMYSGFINVCMAFRVILGPLESEVIKEKREFKEVREQMVKRQVQ
eukprot:m.92606 g.92606  ORF g.92606 m.92606 type:complete len:54 (+) comp36747_c0_seq6:230-391(+)